MVISSCKDAMLGHRETQNWIWHGDRNEVLAWEVTVNRSASIPCIWWMKRQGCTGRFLNSINPGGPSFLPVSSQGKSLNSQSSGLLWMKSCQQVSRSRTSCLVCCCVCLWLLVASVAELGVRRQLYITGAGVLKNGPGWWSKS